MVMFGLLPTLPYQYFGYDQILVFAWMVDNYLARQCFFSQTGLLSFCQCWPILGQPKDQPKFWLAKYFVGQPWAKPNMLYIPSRAILSTQK
jgi:hypothetical protein